MTAKEFLNQAFKFELRVQSKMEQLTRLRASAAGTTTVLSDMPRPASPNPHRMEDTIAKIISLEDELTDDIDRLVDAKIEIKHTIDRLADVDERLVLEARYLNFKNWDEIASWLSMSTDNVFKIHADALNEVEKITVNYSKLQ
jgi:DNA-directed RNA polymerase specialized sigma subunit